MNGSKYSMKKNIKNIIPENFKLFLRRKLPIFFIDKSRSSKNNLIDKYINESNIKVFVETGTYLGDTIYRLRKKFQHLYSIELSDHYYKIALERFKNISNIHLIKGDSAEKLKAVTTQINEPIFFWLDGHYSDGLTAKAEMITPIISELDAIFDNNEKNFRHVILIDDARLFNGSNDYPEYEYLRDYITKKDSKYSVSVEEDIIICKTK